MNFESMWTALEAYQPYAEKRGFGDEWLRMTTERTHEAADAAAEVARWHLRSDAAQAAAQTASTVWTALVSAEPDYWARSAITLITRAVELESKNTA